MFRAIQPSFNPYLYSNVEDFVNSFSIQHESASLQIDDGLPIQLRWTNRSSSITLVVFSAAITRRSAHEVPVFSGWGVTRTLDANVLMISDPSLIIDEQIDLAWYLGSQHQPDLPGTLLRVLQVFASGSRLVLFGASGGGFAALNYAPHLPGATAVVSNPQTNVELFSYFPRYSELAWGNAPITATTSILPLYADAVDANIIYIQNSQDHDHVEKHYSPFIRQAYPGNNILYLTPSLGEGHIGPAPESFTEILTVACSTDNFAELSRKFENIDIYSTQTKPAFHGPDPCLVDAQHPGFTLGIKGSLLRCRSRPTLRSSSATLLRFIRALQALRFRDRY